jgi:leader peptidase (prepilin peptidase)/N-methyltransferase
MRWPREALDAFRQLATPRNAVAAAVAVPLLGLAVIRFGLGGRFAVAAFVIATLSLLAVIDVTDRRIPNRIVLPAAGVVLAAQIALAPDRTLEWILAAAASALVLLLPLLVSPSGVGMGDVKLMLLLGAALGSAVATALIIGSLAAAAYAGLLLVRNGAAGRRMAFPLGPFLAIGGVLALLLQGA